MFSTLDSQFYDNMTDISTVQVLFRYIFINNKRKKMTRIDIQYREALNAES